MTWLERLRSASAATTVAHSPEQEVKAPSGTRFAHLDELPIDVTPDMNRALLCTELNYFGYRHLNRSQTSVDLNQMDAERIRAHAKSMGYESQVFCTYNMQAVIFYNSNEAIVMFEGSRPENLSHYNRNLISYFRGLKSHAPEPFEGMLHGGFAEALNEKVVGENQTIYSAMLGTLKKLSSHYPKMNLHITGHSSGGAIATIAAARLYGDLPRLPCQSIYTFGAPRIGDRAFKNSFQPVMGNKLFRFEQYGDPMPALPPYHYDKYVHVGQWLPMDEKGHFLAMNDDSVIEDTLSRSSPDILSQLPTNESSGNLPPPRRPLPLRETYAVLSNLMNPFNFLKHRMQPYAVSVHAYMGREAKQVPNSKPMGDHEGYLLWTLSELFDRIDDIAPLMGSESSRLELYEVKAALDASMKNLERLHYHREDTRESDTHNSHVMHAQKDISEIPVHRVVARSMSRLRLAQDTSADLIKTLREYEALLGKSDKEQYPSLGQGLVASTRSLIDLMCESLAAISPQAKGNEGAARRA